MLINCILKSRAPQPFRRNAIPVTISALLWILMAFGVWLYPAEGAAPSTAELQENQSHILPPGSPGAATALKAEAQCDLENHAGIARLSWQPADLPGSQQRVDMTMFRDGFQTGQFTTIGPLPPAQAEVNVNSGVPGINYAWRVLTLTDEGWVPSETGQLWWPACPVDRR